MSSVYLPHTLDGLAIERPGPRNRCRSLPPTWSCDGRGCSGICRRRRVSCPRCVRDHPSIWASKAISSFGPARGHSLRLGPVAGAFGSEPRPAALRILPLEPSHRLLCRASHRLPARAAAPLSGPRRNRARLPHGSIRRLRLPHGQHDRRDLPGQRQLGEIRLRPGLEQLLELVP